MTVSACSDLQFGRKQEPRRREKISQKNGSLKRNVSTKSSRSTGTPSRSTSKDCPIQFQSKEQRWLQKHDVRQRQPNRLNAPQKSIINCPSKTMRIRVNTQSKNFMPIGEKSSEHIYGTLVKTLSKKHLRTSEPNLSSLCRSLSRAPRTQTTNNMNIKMSHHEDNKLRWESTKLSTTWNFPSQKWCRHENNDPQWGTIVLSTAIKIPSGGRLRNKKDEARQSTTVLRMTVMMPSHERCSHKNVDL